MKMSIARLLFILATLVSASSATTTIRAAEEPMSFEEKLALTGGAHRSLRELQTTPLRYKGTICRAETKGITTCRTAGSSCLSNQWDYWKLNLQAGVAYTIEVDRISCIMDPAVTLLEGIGTTIPTGCFDDAGSAELALVAFADDNDPEPAYCLGAESSPFADPKFVVTPSASGPFTLAVVNYASDTATCAGATGFQYKIKVNPRPSCV